MPTDDQIKAAGREGKLLGVGLLEPDRNVPQRRLAQCLSEHCDGEVNAGNTMTTSRELKGEEPCTTADVEHVERAPCRENKLKDALPGGPLGGSADTVAKVLIEVRRAPIPMGRHLSLDDISGLPMI